MQGLVLVGIPLCGYGTDRLTINAGCQSFFYLAAGFVRLSTYPLRHADDNFRVALLGPGGA